MIWLLPWGQDNHVKHVSWAVYALIAINAAVFAWTATGVPGEQEAIFLRYGLPVDDWRWYQFVTANFLHGDIVHLVGNMLFLWLFGDSIEDALGTIGFLLLYVVGGLLGDLLYVHNNVGAELPSIGASGCIAAIAGAYGVMFYDRSVNIRLMLLVFTLTTFSVRALWVVLFWFGADLLRTLDGSGQLSEADGVNYVAHGIGFLCGALLGLIARLHGVMRRYERLSQGSAWFGYWPDALERRAGRAMQRGPRRYR
ncbi:MAG: rhomboid family intramembrane serine protease [Pseudomonadota bacterium]